MCKSIRCNALGHLNILLYRGFGVSLRFMRDISSFKWYLKFKVFPASVFRCGLLAALILYNGLHSGSL